MTKETEIAEFIPLRVIKMLTCCPCLTTLPLGSA